MKKIVAVYSMLAACLLTMSATVFSVSGCAQLQSVSESFDKNQAAVKLVVQYAVFKYAEHYRTDERPAHMANMSNVVEHLKAVVSSDEQATLQILDAALVEQLAKLNLSESDRFLARNLADLIEQELQQRIGKGSFDPKIRVQVLTVLDWISEAADLAA